MSEEASAGAEQGRPKRGMKTLVLTALIGICSAAAGFAVPQMLGGNKHEATDESAAQPQAPAGEHGRVVMSCIPFGEVVANLDDNRMMRYVRAKISLGVAEKDSEAVGKVLEENRTILKNWLIGYLQNKQINEVRGTEGFNRIRREIQEQFNELLYAGGDPKIRDVLFDEFNVQ